MNKREQAADKRLQRLYGITLEYFNEMFIDQGGVCAICKRPPRTTRLNVDHDHRYDRFKIKLTKIGDFWIAHCRELEVTSAHRNRKEAKDTVRRMVRRASIRGLLCMSCNKGLQFYRDIPTRFDAAAAYLRRFISHEKIVTAFIPPHSGMLPETHPQPSV